MRKGLKSINLVLLIFLMKVNIEVENKGTLYIKFELNKIHYKSWKYME